jgi:hypothetical protein
MGIPSFALAVQHSAVVKKVGVYTVPLALTYHQPNNVNAELY